MGRICQSVPREAFHRSSYSSRRLTDYFEFLLYAAPIALRCWKHSRQNTGRPCVGRKGTVVSFPHCEQLGFVFEAFVGEKHLFAGGKNELSTTFRTLQYSIVIFHEPLSPGPVPGRRLGGLCT